MWESSSKGRERRRERCNMNQGRKELKESRNNSYINSIQVGTSILSLQWPATTLCESEWVTERVSVWNCFPISSFMYLSWRTRREMLLLFFLFLSQLWFWCGDAQSHWFNGYWEQFSVKNINLAEEEGCDKTDTLYFVADFRTDIYPSRLLSRMSKQFPS